MTDLPIPAGRARRFPVWVLKLAALLCLLEALSFAAIALLNTRLAVTIRRTTDIFAEQSEMVRLMLDPHIPQKHEIDAELGWLYSANYSIGPNTLNAKGLRSKHEYSREHPAGVLRVAAFGDSFTYGSEVTNEDAWARVIEGDGASPPIEVLNYGVPGYGTDQAYLRYQRSGAEYSPEVVLIGFPPTDISRTVNVYRPFFAHGEPPLFKPRYLLDERGELSLLPCPIRNRADYERILLHPTEVLRFAPYDHWFEPYVYRNPLFDYSATVRLVSSLAFRIRRSFEHDRLYKARVFNAESTGFKIECGVMEKFVAAVKERSAAPLVVLLPDRDVLAALQLGRTVSYQPLSDYLAAKRIEFVDGVAAFPVVSGDRSQSLADWFAAGGHYSPSANRLIARWLAGELRRRYPARAAAPSPPSPPLP